jgi:Holliday junction resolvase RusA-like endonuclease
MSDRVAFSVPILPRGKERPRARARVAYQDGRPIAVVSVHSDPRSVELEKAILTAFRIRFPRHQPWTGPVMLRFTAIFPPLAGFTKAQRDAALAGGLYHTAKPDKDNVEKLIVDALNGHAFVDDSQVQGGGVKRYGTPPRIDVVLEKLQSVGETATPSDKRAEARLAAHLSGEAVLGVKTKRTKSGTKQAKLPPHLQARVDAALAKEAKR